MIDACAAMELLAQPRLAVVGASDHPSSAGRDVFAALRDAGCDVVAIHHRASSVCGEVCWPRLGAVPGPPPDGVVVMVDRSAALEAVRDCVALGISRVWLADGPGGPSAVSLHALELCEQAGIDVVAGGCPLAVLGDLTTGPVPIERRLRRARSPLRLVG